MQNSIFFFNNFKKSFKLKKNHHAQKYKKGHAFLNTQTTIINSNYQLKDFLTL